MITTQIINYIQQNQYIYAITIFVCFFLLSKLVVFISEKILSKITVKTKTRVDDLIIEKMNKPISLLLVFLGCWFAMIPLDLGTVLGFGIKAVLKNIFESISVFIATKIIIGMLDITIDEWGRNFATKTNSKRDDQLLSLLHRFLRILLWIVGFLLILSFWGFKVGPFLASLGIAGIAVAFALQSTLANIFGGITLILDKSVKVGDIIRLDASTAGTVIDVGLRSTKIKSYDNEVIVVPNGKLVDSRIENFGMPDPSIRVVVDFGVEYGSDVDKVKEVIMSEIEKLNILKDPAPVVLFMQMADFSLNFSARFWIESYTERLEMKEKATCAFYKALNAAKIGIPFPTRTVYLKK